MYNLIRHVNIRYTCTKSELGLKNKCIQAFMEDCTLATTSHLW